MAWLLTGGGGILWLEKFTHRLVFSNDNLQSLFSIVKTKLRL
jgi:hypothetical protein